MYESFFVILQFFFWKIGVPTAITAKASISGVNANPDDKEKLKLLYINPCHAELIKMPHPLIIFQPIRLLDLGYGYKCTYLVTNSADPDQLASEEANWSGSTLFAKAGHIRVQRDKC